MDHPRVVLNHAPTPIEPLPRLSEDLGISLAVKRDDIAGVSFGGNKTRQLEFYLGAAEAEGADTILITGAVQSNFVRTAAASAAKLGMRTIVQLEDRVPGMGETYAHSGNVLLSEILGAEVMRYPKGEDEAGADRALHLRADALRAEGRRPFVIPLGLSARPLGALGYMRAADEIRTQGGPWDAIVVASGSGLTHAGLLAGLRAAGDRTRVVGSCVRRAAELQGPRIAKVVQAIEGLVGGSVGVGADDIEVWDGALAPGYGRLGPLAADAMRSMARREGLFLDPVYTAKVFAAVPALVRSGAIAPKARVLFIHTGGLPALFAYEPEVRTALETAERGT